MTGMRRLRASLRTEAARSMTPVARTASASAGRPASAPTTPFWSSCTSTALLPGATRSANADRLLMVASARWRSGGENRVTGARFRPEGRALPGTRDVIDDRCELSGVRIEGPMTRFKVHDRGSPHVRDHRIGEIGWDDLVLQAANEEARHLRREAGPAELGQQRTGGLQAHARTVLDDLQHGVDGCFTLSQPP